MAQVITRWLIEIDIIVLAKSTKLERMAENLNIFDFALSDEDKAEIAKLDSTFAAIVNHDMVDNLKPSPRGKWTCKRSESSSGENLNGSNYFLVFISLKAPFLTTRKGLNRSKEYMTCNNYTL